MAYDQPAAYADIATLQNFWSTYAANSSNDAVAAVDAMRRLIYQASFDPAIKLIVAASNVFTDALSLEPEALADVGNFTASTTDTSIAPLALFFDTTSPPRWWMLDGIRSSLEPSFFSLGKGDPNGIAAWIALVDPAGTALAKAISSDPLPDVRLAALQLVKSTALPISWVRPLLAAIDALQSFVASSSFSQAYRTSLNALASEARAAVQLTANQTAQGTNFKALTAGGQEIDMGEPPPRAVSLPWYKRIELWGALVGGVVGGVKLFERRSR